MSSGAAWSRPRILPALFLFFGVGITIWLAIRTSGETPFNGETAALAVIAASAFQLAAAVGFSRVGVVGKLYARSAGRRMLAIGQLQARARDALDDSDISAAIALVEQALFETEQALQDWSDVHEVALSDLGKIEG